LIYVRIGFGVFGMAIASGWLFVLGYAHRTSRSGWRDLSWPLAALTAAHVASRIAFGIGLAVAALVSERLGTYLMVGSLALILAEWVLSAAPRSANRLDPENRSNRSRR
jgi:hypothetical protein